MPEVPVPWLEEVLGRYDPVGAWEAMPRPSSPMYRSEAAAAAIALQDFHGLGHAKTLVADALDQLHPGIYQSVVEGDLELNRRLNRVAQEIWDRFGVVVPSQRLRQTSPTDERSQRTIEQPPVRGDELVANDTILTRWLREVEAVLASRRTGSTDPRNAGAFQDALPGLLASYAGATDERRKAVRIVFSRFRFVRYQLSAFATVQYQNLNGPNSSEALRLALLAEALLDGGIDWRDKLLLLRDIRLAATEAGAEFDRPLEEAIRCSGARSRRLLSSLEQST